MVKKNCRRPLGTNNKKKATKFAQQSQRITLWPFFYIAMDYILKASTSSGVKGIFLPRRRAPVSVIR